MKKQNKRLLSAMLIALGLVPSFSYKEWDGIKCYGE